MRICIVGVGNTWATDDGLGPEIVRQLQAEYQADKQNRYSPSSAPVVTFAVLPQAGLELIDLMPQCELLILVDAVHSGAKPGTMHCEEWQPGLLASRGTERASTHGLGLDDVLKLAAALGKLPLKVILGGLEVASTRPGPGLSADVAKVVPDMVAQLKRELVQLGGSKPTVCSGDFSRIIA